jgi:hypothetical protein
MGTLAFPLSSDAPGAVFGVCPVCEAKLGRTFAFICGGSLADEGVSLRRSVGFLDVGVHGAHSEGLNEPSACISVLSGDRLGQFERAFWSLGCLRAFLNLAVDQLESRLSAEGEV